MDVAKIRIEKKIVGYRVDTGDDKVAANAADKKPERAAAKRLLVEGNVALRGEVRARPHRDCRLQLGDDGRRCRLHRRERTRT